MGNIHQEDQKEDKLFINNSIQNTQSTKSSSHNAGATLNSVSTRNTMNMMRLTRQEIQSKKLN